MEDDKISSGYITPTFLATGTRAVVLHDPSVLWGPQWNKTTLEVATSPLPSQRTESGW